MKRNITLWLCKTAALLACATSAYAVNTGAELFLWDGTAADNKAITDGGAGDQNLADAGVVGFNGSVGGNWTLNVDTGVSKPLDGSASHPFMDLEFGHMNSVGAGTLGVAFFDNGFTSSLAGALAGIGGTLPNGVTLTYATYTRAGNTAATFTGGTLDLTGWTLLTTQTFTTAGPFSGSKSSGSISGGANPYSLLQVITITAGGTSHTTGDATLQAPDGGMTLMLLGSSLTALGLLRRSFKSKA